MTDLQVWLIAELRKWNLSARQASLGADLGHAQVSRYLNGKRPSAENCRKLARFFGVPEDFLLRLAGYVAPASGEDEFLSQLAPLLVDLPASEKEEILEYVRWRRRLAAQAAPEGPREDGGRSP